MYAALRLRWWWRSSHWHGGGYQRKRKKSINQRSPQIGYEGIKSLQSLAMKNYLVTRGLLSLVESCNNREYRCHENFFGSKSKHFSVKSIKVTKADCLHVFSKQLCPYGLVSITQQMPRLWHENKSIIRLSSHPSHQSLCFDSKLVVVVVVIGLMESRFMDLYFLPPQINGPPVLMILIRAAG